MKLKIATWNLERPKFSSANNPKLMGKLSDVDADILVLTETNAAINPGERYKKVASDPLTNADGANYGKGEIRTSIWSKFDFTHETLTYNPKTAVVALISTPLGELNVYGTIIGVFGGRHKTFQPELEAQIADWEKIAAGGPICIVGDFNLTFKGIYHTKVGRRLINECFERLEITNLTCDIENNIDHITISESFMKHAKSTTEVWNEDKTLSDHIGVSVALEI